MNQPNPHAHLRAAFTAGCRIQAWHLNDGAKNSNDGRWDTLAPSEGREPEFGCAPHLYRVHPEDEAKALAVWDFRMPTMHQPDGVRFYIERLVSNTDPAGMVRENLLLREEVTRLSTLIAELGQEVGAVAVPDGWALVPKQMALTPESLGLIETMCAGPDNEGIGGEGGEDRWVDGLLWVGETSGDDGEKYWGLNIACAECLDEGSLPIVEFDRPTSPAHTSEARDAQDAKRYRWLRDCYDPSVHDGDCDSVFDLAGNRFDEKLDLMIENDSYDASMRQEAE